MKLPSLRATFDAIGIVLVLASCANLQSTASKAQVWLNSPSGRTNVALITGAASALTASSPHGTTDLSLAREALSSIETGKPPDADTISANLAAFKVPAATVKAIAPNLSQAIGNALAAGVAPNTAVELVAARGLDPTLAKAAAAAAASP